MDIVAVIEEIISCPSRRQASPGATFLAFGGAYDAEHGELKEIACYGLNRGVITKHHSHHYFGFAETEWKLLLKESPRR